MKQGEPDLLGDLVGVADYGFADERELFDNRDGKEEAFAKAFIEFGDASALAARAAIRDGADVISISVDSGDTLAWDQVMIEAMRAKVPVVVATDNPTDEIFSGGLTRIYMANGIVPINAIEQDGSPLQGDAQYAASGSSNLAGAAPGRDLLGVGDNESGWGPELIHGTSYATPLVAGTIALGLQAFPDATSNQILQAMIRTTSNGGVHAPVWESQTVGYGFINPGGLLQSDPTIYPDENPLFVTSIDDPRCVFPDGQPGKELTEHIWNCYWASAPTPQTVTDYWAVRDGGAATDPGKKPGSELAGGVPVWMLVAGGLGLLVVIAVAVIVPIAVSRSKKRVVLVGAPQQYQQYRQPQQQGPTQASMPNVPPQNGQP